MNSFVNTVPRKSRAGGASNEKEQGGEELYSGAAEREGGDVEPNGDKARKGSASGSVGKKLKGAEAAGRAFAAMKRTRAPFTAEESFIGRADDTTLPLQDEDEVEITLEELAQVPAKGQLFGHKGWVAGGDLEEEEEVEGEQKGGRNFPLSAAGTGRSGAENEGAAKIPDQHSDRTVEVEVSSVQGVRAKVKRRPRRTTKTTADGYPDDDDDGGSGIGLPSSAQEPEDPGDGAEDPDGKDHLGRRSGGTSVGMPADRVEDAAEGPPTRSPSGRRKRDAASERIESEPAERVTGNEQVKLKIPLFDERVSRTELKHGRRESAKGQKAALRRQAGVDRKARRDFEDAVDELRNANPLKLGVDEN